MEIFCCFIHTNGKFWEKELLISIFWKFFTFGFCFFLFRVPTSKRYLAWGMFASLFRTKSFKFGTNCRIKISFVNLEPYHWYDHASCFIFANQIEKISHELSTTTSSSASTVTKMVKSVFEKNCVRVPKMCTLFFSFVSLLFLSIVTLAIDLPKAKNFEGEQPTRHQPLTFSFLGLFVDLQCLVAAVMHCYVHSLFNIVK